MAGGVRVVQPDLQPGERTPEIDTVPVVVDGEQRERQRITVADSSPRVAWSEVVDVAPGASVDVASMVGEARLKIRGITATGNGDGAFHLLVDGLVVLGGRINRNRPTLELQIPMGLPLAPAAVATVQVTCDAVGLADFEATILAEVTHG